MFLTVRFLVRYSLGSCLFVLASLLCHPTNAWGTSTKKPIVQVDVINSRDQYPAGETYPILFKVNVATPWYIHGTKAGADGLIPTALSFSNLPGLTVEDLRFPPPEKKKFEYTNEPVEVFSRQFYVRARLRVNPEITSGEYLIKGGGSLFRPVHRACVYRRKKYRSRFPYWLLPRAPLRASKTRQCSTQKR